MCVIVAIDCEGLDVGSNPTKVLYLIKQNIKFDLIFFLTIRLLIR